MQQQGPRTRVAGTTANVHAVQQRGLRCHQWHRTTVSHSNALSRQQSSTRGCIEACTISCSDSSSAQRDEASIKGPSQQHCSQNSRSLWFLPTVVAHQLCMALHMQSHAAESVPPTAFALFREFVDQIDALGPWGGVLFVVTVMCAEMIPLFPTQPLTLASGLLFGPFKGALFVVIGVTLAAINAYSLSKGIGRKLAEKVIAHEVGEQQGPVQQQLATVTQAIESGGFVQQVTAITLLRLTPVVPFSASNYLLGLTPVQLGPLVAGTVAGMSVWSVLYASLGGASKVLLEGGADLDVLMEDLVEKAGKYSEDVAVTGLILGVLALSYYLVSQRLQPAEDGPGDEHPHHHHPHHQALDVAQNSQREEVLQNK